MLFRFVLPLRYVCVLVVLVFTCNVVTSTGKLNAVKRRSHINESMMGKYLQYRMLHHDDTLFVYGNSHLLSYYYLDLYIGNSFQKQSYIIDTGSSITASPCKPLCIDCGKHKNSYFEITSTASILHCESEECSTVSSTCNDKSQCEFSITYTEGSELHGVYVNEVIHFKPNNTDIANTNTTVPLGCTTKETHLFSFQLADGIIGLSNSHESFISILHNKGIISKNIFTICLSEYGGYFSLGEIDTKYHKSTLITYIPLYNSNDPFYTLNIKKVNVGDKYSIALNESRNFAIIDSGATLTYIPNVYYNNIITYFNEILCVDNTCGTQYTDAYLGLCYEFISDIDLINTVATKWPDIVFVVGDDVEFMWKAESYYYNSSTVLNNGTYVYKACVGFVGTKEDRFILGANWMKGKDVVFDRERQRIGFVEAFCHRNETDEVVIEEGVEGEEQYYVDEKDDTEDEDENENEDELVQVNDDSDSSDDEEVKRSVDVQDVDEGNNTVSGYIKVYCVVCVLLFGVVVLLGWMVFTIQNKVRKNMQRLEQEVENEPELVKLGMDVVSPVMMKNKSQSKIVITNQSESSDNNNQK